MASGYPFNDIEKKWQKTWEEDGTYRAEDTGDEKFYGLIEFPYPSGEGLHVGHPRSYTAIDIVTRKQRMDGKNVLYPIGWDAFGLPTENFAIKNKIKPQDATVKNIANFTRQIKSLGIGFDWSREIDTTDPKYYKWTQWMFLRFFESYFDDVEGRALPIDELAIPDDVTAQGESAVRAYIDGKRMAFKAETKINWCPRCRIGLANEEAQGGVCERCGEDVEQRTKAQWMIRITKYADRLIEDLETVDYLEKIRAQQINWIGKSEGAYVDFPVVLAKAGNRTEKPDSRLRGNDTQLLPDKVTVFTTRPDTLFGATYLVLAPEHPLIETWLDEGDIENADDVRGYQEGTKMKSELQRQERTEKTGIPAKGIMAKNPATGEMIPVWIADYVLGGYGTGAIMAVPAHDERDFEFAKTFKLPVRKVVLPPSLGGVNSNVQDQAAGVPSEMRIVAECWTESGFATNSGFLDGLSTADAKEKMIEWLEDNKIGEAKTTYKLRDWVFSRQRYWGEPIPIVMCQSCGFVPVPDDQLPLVLPDVDAYEPSETGESPLANIRSWVETSCPKCGGKAERETDTMPNWAGSSWYFLRYCDPKNGTTFADPKKLKYWMPVDLYNGGMEHTTLHLLYSRFWYKMLWDLGYVPRECGSEPYAKRRSHALILGEGGVKMSKSKGNVVNPDDVVSVYGADVFRMYEMFIGPFDADAPWDTNGIEGVKRFLDKVWKIFGAPRADALTNEAETLLNQTVKKVGEDIEGLHFNTAVSAMMILVNELSDSGMTKDAGEKLLKVLAPFAPHLTEELWEKYGGKGSIHRSEWPKFDPSKLVASTFELVIQVNGKVRDRMTVDSEISEEEATKLAMGSEKVQAYVEGKMPSKIVYVKGRLLSISI
ncbi:leucine--tRNA ligase [Patescibacteria group bacterium]|nr:leucine--tRNA ligase [Patescibacteria group bacterium]